MLGPAIASVSRLGTVYPSAQAAIALIKQFGIIPGWDEYWDRYFGYELRDINGGARLGASYSSTGRTRLTWQAAPSGRSSGGPRRSSN